MHSRRISRVLFALALASPLAAQAREAATFYLIVGTDTVTAERVERSPSELSFMLFDMKTRARIDFTGRLLSNGLFASATQTIYRDDVDTTALVRAEARFLNDSVGVTRSGATNWIRVGSGAMPSLNVSAALLEQSLIRGKAMGGDSVTIPLLFMPAGPAVPVTILFQGGTATARIGGVAINATIDPAGRLLGATIPSQNARYARGPATSGAAPGRKSFAPPAGAPYSAQEVTLRTPAGITLRGTLTLPQRAYGTRVPAVVTITGSGPQDRDATPAGLSRYRIYYQLSDTLARRGVAVLRLDDRGAGSDVGPMTVTTADFADDIRAGVAWLRSRPEIDPARIGLVGHSEGGIIAPMVASTDTAIAAVVIMAGTVSTGREVITFQQRYMVDSVARLLGQQREGALAMYARNTDSMAVAMPWMKFFLDYDGRAAAARVRAPVLVLHGEKDYQVPVAEAEKTAAAVRAGGNRDVTVRVVPDANHLFLPHGGVGFSYDKLPSFVVPSDVMGTLADWLTVRLRR